MISSKILRRLIFLGFIVLLITSSQAVPLQEYSAQAMKTAKDNGSIIVLHFFKPNCGTCVVQANFLKALRTNECTQCKNVVFFSVNVNDHQDLMTKFGVHIPSVIVVVLGDKSLEVVGETDPAQLLKFINDTTNLSFQ